MLFTKNRERRSLWEDESLGFALVMAVLKWDIYNVCIVIEMIQYSEKNGDLMSGRIIKG